MKVSNSGRRLAAALLAAVTFGGLQLGLVETVAAAPAVTPPGQVIADAQRGSALVARGSAQLQARVARVNGMTTSELRSAAQDRSLWVGRDGRLFFVEPAQAAAPASMIGTEPPAVTGPLSETFQLHSRPGSKRTIYLDFDGYDGSGTAWDDGSAPTVAAPYSMDGSSAFSDAELAQIQTIWQRVAEDYAPFDVDVTTQDPGIDAIRRSSSSDLVYGTRAVITPTMTYNCSCAGVAYVGTFDTYGTRSDGSSQHDYYQPAWVFMGPSSYVPYIALTTSHEVGHNLGLDHDGTTTSGYYGGHANWEPIMGGGTLRPVTQWSRGEYAGASNTQDDFSVMGANGAVAMVDDFADGSPQALTDPVVDVSGLVHSRTDTDTFSFTTASAGQVTLSAAASAVGPNLDIRMTLMDSLGNVVADSNPVSGTTGSGSSTEATGMSASIDVAVAAGAYTVRIDGVGAGTVDTGYSDYGSVGRYRLTGTIPTGTVVTNRAPVADAAANGSTFQAPASIQLSGAASSDPDGDSLAYTWTVGGSVVSNDATFTYTTSNAGTHTFTLSVSDGALTSTDQVSVTVTAPPAPPAPAAPSSVRASQSGSTVKVTWRDRSTNETGFRVIRETRGADGSWATWSVLGTTGANITSFKDTSLVVGATYRYKVVAFNAGGTSSASSSLAVKIRAW